jgi:hypothetical protein
MASDREGLWGFTGAINSGLEVRALLLLVRLLLLSSLLEQIIQSKIDPSLVNVAPEGAIGGNNPISPVFPHDLDAVYGGSFPSVSRWNERKVC